MVRDLRNRGRFQVIAPWWEAATVVDLRRAGGRLVVRSRWVDHTGASRPCPVRASWRSRKDVIRVVIPRRCGSTYGWANGEGGPALNVIARLGKQRERAGTFVVRQQWEAEHHTADWARRTFDEVLASVRSGTRATLSDQNLIEEEDWTRLWNRFGGAATSAVDCRAHDNTDGFPIIDCAVAQDGVQTNFYAYLHWTGGTSTGWRVRAVYFDV